MNTKLANLCLAGLVAVIALPFAPAADAQEPAAEPGAVIAFLDDGINPYHEVFRDDSPQALEHPSTYIPDYPEDALPLNLTLDAPSFAAAIAADCDVWESVKSGQLYYVPGTRIVGAIEWFDAAPVCPRDAQGNIEVERTFEMPILGGAHGTMVASRGAGAGYGACPTCRIVSINHARPVPAVTWSSDNAGWIDVDSNSWGYDFGVNPLLVVLAGPEQGIDVDGFEELTNAVETNALKHLSFRASGNGAGTLAGTYSPVPNPTLTRYDLTPSAIAVGGVDSGYMATWPGTPSLVVSDSCDSWAAEWDSLDVSGDSIGGGTSAASPFAAGGAARILLDARQILGDTRTGVHDGVVASGPPGLVSAGPLADGTFTLEEFRRLVLVTASPRPVAQVEDGPPCAGDLSQPAPVRWKDVPPGYPEYVHIGYGAVDRQALQRAAQVLRGGAPPDRTVTDTYFAGLAAAQGVAYEYYRDPPTGNR